ncbi:hypothetical protein EVAR_61934_1 [Eumeta japonica]|uniref:Uncharacterized protein n=1 Tax=Eumeta variegata TaxID=151549 RepID=A0A4C1ZGX3_EUMVA|nr:hypothetical protein EVAR_61934_1 [Eumeta japonica]
MNVNGLNTKNRAKWQDPSTSCVQRPVQRLPDSSVPKNISKPLEQDIEGPSPSQNDADFEGIWTGFRNLGDMSEDRRCVKTYASWKRLSGFLEY